jgi:diadenosine tetraphosphate (Ap4A) HIT family hydrolase
MEGIQARGECPFCPDNLHKTHTEPLLIQGEHWTLTPSRWPYASAQTHLLAIAAYHAETLSDLKPGAFDELQEQFVWAQHEYDIKSGGLAMRFGDVALNGATVNHLHAHLIVPTPGTPREDKIRFKIG